MRIQIIIIKVQHMEFLPRFLHFKLNVQNHLQVQTTHKIKWEIFYLNMETARREFVLCVTPYTFQVVFHRIAKQR